MRCKKFVVHIALADSVYFCSTFSPETAVLAVDKFSSTTLSSQSEIQRGMYAISVVEAETENTS